MPRLDPAELTDLTGTVERLLAERWTEADHRRSMEGDDSTIDALRGEFTKLGLAGLIVPETHGGAGLGAVELERVMEAIGAALAPTAFLSSGVLAASLLTAIGGEATARLLPGIATGETRATAALTGPAATWTRDAAAVTVDGDRLTGDASFVTDAAGADLLLVIARQGDDIAIAEVDPAAPGVVITPLPAFDRSLRLANIRFEQAACRLLENGDWPAVETALATTRVAVAGLQAGGTARVLQSTVRYAKERFQFGRAIGSFQAIKHMAADMLLESESATSAARHAAAALDAGGDPGAIALAAFACADAYTAATAASIQMHGGIAFTWEHPAHLYFRRARALAQLFGSPAAHREAYVRALEAA